ncbi:MAG: ABC transporter ATP-binding protein [Acidobacteriia bacterium]|nr:ABC transporter ATP-binding protein [Terriglobia bacterium]
MEGPAEIPVETLALVHSLSVTYLADGDQPVRALDQATLEIRSGELVGILGESGSGKSTLAAAWLRLLPADARYDSGSIRFRGRDVLALPDSEMRRMRGAEIALISQDPALSLNPVISVGDQIAEVLRAHVRMTRRDRRTRVEELLTEVGFDQPRKIYHAYPHQLSGGQRQRVAIAQAVACRPALVIADEPTSKLDASLQAEILSLMRDISHRHHTAFVLISHDPTVLAGFVDRIAVMYAGRIVEEGSTQDIFRRPLHPYTQALVRLSARYLANAGARTRFGAIESEPSDLSLPAAGCPFAPRCPERMQVCTERNLQETIPQPSHRVSCFKYDH